MLKKVDINTDIGKELQEVAPVLATLDRRNFYQVPEAYFEQFTARINAAVGVVDLKSETLPLVLSTIEKKELYSSPSPLYFQSFSESLTARMHAEEVAEELSYSLPALQHVEKKELYKVPASYFASFPETITRMASREGTAHTSQTGQWLDKLNLTAEKLFSRVFRPVWSFAMASVVGVIVCFGLVANNRTLSDEDKIFAEMQQIPDADLHHYIAKHRDEFDEHTILHDINNVEFTHYFDKPEQVTPHIEGHIKADQSKDDDNLNEDILD